MLEQAGVTDPSIIVAESRQEIDKDPCSVPTAPVVAGPARRHPDTRSGWSSWIRPPGAQMGGHLKNAGVSARIRYYIGAIRAVSGGRGAAIENGYVQLVSSATHTPYVMG